jgi:hypothetical protein
MKTSHAKVMLVGFDGKDPSPSFLQRFSNDKILIRKYSQRVEKLDGSRKWYYVVDKPTGLEADVLVLRDLKWRGPFKAQLEVNHGAGYIGTSAHPSVVLSIEGWVVTDTHFTSVSME